MGLPFLWQLCRKPWTACYHGDWNCVAGNSTFSRRSSHKTKYWEIKAEEKWFIFPLLCKTAYIFLWQFLSLSLSLYEALINAMCFHLIISSLWALLTCGERWDIKIVSTPHMIQPYTYLTLTTVLCKCDKLLWKATRISTDSKRGIIF